MLNKLFSLFRPPDLGDEEKNRVAEILNVIALSILTGFIILVLQRAIAGHYDLFIQTLSAGALIILSIVFLRQGKLKWAEALLLWTLLGFIAYLIYTSDGLHNIALLGIPICLVFAGIALRTKYFISFTLLTILAVVAIGYFEITGKLVNQYSHHTNLLSVIDIVVIFSVTAVAVRILSDNLLRSIHKARTSEKEIRQQAEELRESEEKFRTLTEELPNMVFIYKKNRRIVYVNEKCKELIGYSREEIYAPEFDFLSIIAPENRNLVAQQLEQHLAGIEIEPFECTLMGKGNKRIECLHMSKLIHFEGEPAVLGLVANLTELKRTQQAVWESQSRLSSIITSAMEAIITLDQHQRILSFNPASELMFCCSEEEAIGQSIERFIAPQQNNEGYGNELSNKVSIVNLLEGRMGTINGIRVNGEVFPVEASISKVKAGKEELYTIILRDITERVKSEETQRNLQAQLFQSQKMEAIGSLAGGIAHDFNNILSVIIGNSELVKLELTSSHRAMKHIDEVINASDRAQELVQRILSFSRKQESQFRPVRLHYVLREAMKLLRASIPATIEIKMELQTNGPLILADPTQIHQVVMNLCTNAAHSMEGTNGKLTLKQKSVELDDRSVLYHPDLKKGRYTVFTVQDTGIGMDGFTLKRIYEPFFTTKGPGKGTGLGLTIVHAIIKNHGGATKIQSQMGKGTQVDIFLPIYEGEELNTPPEEIKESTGSAESIMIVDDEPQLLETFTLILKGLGYKVFPFTSSPEALHAFEKNPSNYDLIITDHTMPHMTGTHLANKIRQANKVIPIILMTGYDQLEDPEKLKMLGISTVLLKPFKKSILAETIKKVLEKS